MSERYFKNTSEQLFYFSEINKRIDPRSDKVYLFSDEEINQCRLLKKIIDEGLLVEVDGKNFKSLDAKKEETKPNPYGITKQPDQQQVWMQKTSANQDIAEPVGGYREDSISLDPKHVDRYVMDLDAVRYPKNQYETDLDVDEDVDEDFEDGYGDDDFNTLEIEDGVFKSSSKQSTEQMEVWWCGPAGDAGGYGKMNRECINGLYKKGVKVHLDQPSHLIPDMRCLVKTTKEMEDMKKTQVSPNAPSVWGVMPPSFLNRQGRKILFTMIETGEVPKAFVDKCNNADELWLPCFTPDTNVLTKYGYKRIDNVKIGEEVVTHLGNLKKINKISKKGFRGNVFNINVNGEVVSSTEDHPFYVAELDFHLVDGIKKIKKSRLKFIKAKDLDKNRHFAIIPKYKKNTKNVFSLNICKILSNDDYQISETEDGYCERVYYQKIRHKNRSMEENSDIVTEHIQKRKQKFKNLIKIDSNFVSIIGYYLAKGSQESKNMTGINFVFHKDESQYIHDLSTKIKKVFNISPKIEYKNNICRIRLLNSVISRLFQYIVPSGAKNKKINSDFYQMLVDGEISLIEVLLCSYFNGDGYISKKYKEISCLTVSEDLKKQILHMGYLLGIVGKTYVGVSKYKNKEFGESYSISYTGVQIDKIKKTIKKTNKINNALKNKRSQRFYEDDKNYYFKIREIGIEEVDTSVFNLEVEDDETYIVGWCAVHNCKFNMEIFSQANIKPEIHYMPLGVNTDLYKPMSLTEEQRSKVKFQTKGFVFLSLFGWSLRKGVDILFKSYLQEFTEDDDVTLLVVSRKDGSSAPEKNKEIRDQIREYINRWCPNRPHPHVVHIGDALPEEVLPIVYNMADCFVLPSRGEGYGLPYAEAGACEVPVIASRCGGQLDFLTDENSYLVDIDGYDIGGQEIRALSSYYEKAPFAVLGESAVIQMKEYMKFVYKSQSSAKEKAKLLRQNIIDNFTWDQLVERVYKRLKNEE